MKEQVTLQLFYKKVFKNEYDILFRHKRAEKTYQTSILSQFKYKSFKQKEMSVEIRMSMKKSREPEILTVWISTEISVSYYLNHLRAN